MKSEGEINCSIYEFKEKTFTLTRKADSSMFVKYEGIDKPDAFHTVRADQLGIGFGYSVWVNEQGEIYPCSDCGKPITPNETLESSMERGVLHHSAPCKSGNPKLSTEEYIKSGMLKYDALRKSYNSLCLEIKELLDATDPYSSALELREGKEKDLRKLWVKLGRSVGYSTEPGSGRPSELIDWAKWKKVRKHK